MAKKPRPFSGKVASNASKTAAEKRILAAPAEAFRKLSKIELEKLGLSPKAERYIETGKRVSKNTKTISKRAFIVKKTGASPEALVEARVAGRRLYQSRITQEAAEKQKTTRGRQRERRLIEEIQKPLTSKQIDRDTKNFAKKLENNPRAVPGPNAKRPRSSYSIDVSGFDRLSEFYERKLRGEFVPDGIWHQLIDAARATGDKNLGRLLQSKQDKSPEYDWETDLDLEEAA